MRAAHRISPILVLLLGWCAEPVSAADAAPLHETIDRLIADSATDYRQRASQPAADQEFVRRVYLDLAGRIPSAEQARDFIEDDACDKRTRLVDQLLASPQHARRLQYVFDAVLMQRREQKHVKLDQWRAYLFGSFRKNKPWDRLTREILSSDGADREQRAAARFLLDRELKIDETTRDIGRIFLGRDLQCAQCHDHPEIDDYAQRHYYGISAFVQRSYVFTDPKSKQASIGEKAEGTVKFTSVFTSEEAETQPRILDLPEVTDPQLAEEPYVAKPDKNTRGVPQYSRRLQLASALTTPENQAFRQNIANRLWALVIGRGLVEPVDMFHEANPASHPELLEVLSDDLHRHGYDLRRIIREIMLSQSYQRSSQLATADEPTAERYYSAVLKPLTPEQLAWSTMQATGVLHVARSKISQRLAEEHPQLEQATPDHAFQLEQAVHDELHKHVATFVEVFASHNEASGFDATADQALFLLNGELLTEWLQPVDGNLVDRLLRLADRASIVQEVYLSTLTRRASQAEIDAAGRFLESFGDDQQSGIQELIRTILCSAEFRLNH